MNKNTEMYNFAKSFLGKGGATFRSYCGLPSGAAWCNAFVTYIFHKSGNASLYCNGKKQTYCPTSIKICRSNMAEIPMYLAMPSDVIYFDWDRNGVPNHIGFVRAHNTTDSIYTIEGNTSNKVMNKTRPAKYVCGIFRPHFKANFTLKKLAVDGDCGYNTIAGLQKALQILKYYNGSIDGILGQGTVKALQRWAGTSADGAWGKGTSKAVQKKIGTTADGAFGKNSVIALQKWINNNAFPSVSGGATTAPKPAAPKPATTSNAQKLVNKAAELAWPYGTASSKWDYKKGAPTSKCKAAMKKHGYTSKGKQSSCIYFMNTIVRETGINKSFCAGHGYKKPYPKTEAGFNTVLSGKAIPSGFLKPGDIVRYKKTSKDEHTLMYMGNGRICEARHYHRYGNIYKDEKRYNGSNVKKSTLQVLRAK